MPPEASGDRTDISSSRDVAWRIAVSEWQIAADPANEGLESGWYRRPPAVRRPADAGVPLQRFLPGYHGVVWYWASVKLPSCADDEQWVLRVEGAHYQSTAWVDGSERMRHEGQSRYDLPVSTWGSSGRSVDLALRVVSPGATRVDGYLLSEIPYGNAQPDETYFPGRAYAYGGLLGPVTLWRRKRPAAADELVATPDLDRRVVEIAVASPVTSADVAVVRAELRDQVVVARAAEEVPVHAGTCRLTLPVDAVRPWSPDDPYLYELTVTVFVGEEHATYHRRVGFRSFGVDAGGFFRLNGQPIFVRSTHTGNHVPPGVSAEIRDSLLIRDLMNAKAVGLNMVRFLSGPATERQLQICDEIGLMVYLECRGSWPQGYSRDLELRYDAELFDLVRRDRRYTSVVAWGLLNETADGPMFDHVRGVLPELRELDASRLVVLSSGRWDGRPSVGSVCNPGSDEWEPLWGAEASGAPIVSVDPLDKELLGYVPRTGDRHVYPRVPHDAATVDLLRGMGGEPGEKPVFLSEYGVGSQLHVIDELAAMRSAGAWLDSPEGNLIATMAQRLDVDFERLRLNRVYPFPADFLDASRAAHSRYRLDGIGHLRANPHLVGHNITGMLDHAVTGEGLWSFAERRFKPGIVDALRDALAPLRWCLSVSAVHSHVGVPVTIRIAIADERWVITPGSHRITMRVLSESGVVIEREVDVDVRQPTGRASFVLQLGDMTLDANLAAGRYSVAFQLDAGLMAPVGGVCTVHRWDAPASATSGVVVGADGDVAAWLTRRGVTCSDDPRVVADATGAVVVLSDHPVDRAMWQELRRPARDRRPVVLCDVAALLRANGEEVAALGVELEAVEIFDWLYHGEWFGTGHSLFRGLPGEGRGLLDWDLYAPVLPRSILKSPSDPDDVAAGWIAVGHPSPGGYDSGYLAASWPTPDGGQVFATTLAPGSRVADSPAAARLLLNLLQLTSGG